MTGVDVPRYLSLLFAPLGQVAGAIVLSVVPGWWVAERVDVEPLTRLLVAAIASFTLSYLLAFGAYLASLPQSAALGVLVALAFVSVGDVVRRRRAAALPFDGVVAWLGLAIWILGFQSRIVVYGGGTWFGDWHEHYERAVFFLDRLPPTTKFLYDTWSLPARGPLFNACAAVLMTAFGRAFADYQSVATVLNTFPVVPMALLLRDMGRLSRRAALVWSVVLFGVAPFAVPQETFTWTKFFTVGFVLGGIHLYRTALRQNRPRLAGGSFVVFAAGVLAHYFVVPFAAFFAVHLVYTAVRRRWGWRDVVEPALAGAVLAATWFAYALATFGVQATVTANSTFGDYAAAMPGPYGVPASRGVVFVGNLVTTALPYSWRHGLTGMGYAPPVVQMDPRASAEATPIPAELNRKTEWFSALANNQGSILGMLGFAGTAGVVLATALAIRRRPREPPDEPGWIFWLAFFAAGIPLGILTVADYSPHGTAHVNLQPFACLAAVLVFRRLRDLPRWVNGCLIAVFLAESALSTGARLYLQERRVPIVVQDGRAAVTAKLDVDATHVNNYLLKLNTRAEFLSDRLGELSAPFSLIALVLSLGLLAVTGTSTARPRGSGSSDPA